VGRVAPDCADLMEGEVGMEGDDADARKERAGRAAASDAEEGDECGDMTFVGGRALVAVMGPIGGEWRVEQGEGVMQCCAKSSCGTKSTKSSRSHRLATRLDRLNGTNPLTTVC
jgi:hypothetical protein